MKGMQGSNIDSCNLMNNSHLEYFELLKFVTRVFISSENDDFDDLTDPQCCEAVIHLCCVSERDRVFYTIGLQFGVFRQTGFLAPISLDWRNSFNILFIWRE